MNNKGKTLHALILKFGERKAHKKYLTQLIFTSHITLAFTTLILNEGYTKLDSQTSMLVFSFYIDIYLTSNGYGMIFNEYLFRGLLGTS